MILGALGLAASIGGSIMGGLQASEAQRKSAAEMSAQRRKNDNWYQRRYNEDYTQTAEAQNLLRKARQNAQDQVRAALGRQAVMGGTEESVDATRASANSMVSDTLGNIAAIGSERKANIDKQYKETDRSISDNYVKMYNAQAEASSKAASEALKSGMGLLTSELGSKLNTGKSLWSNMFGKEGISVSQARNNLNSSIANNANTLANRWKTKIF